MSRSILLKSQRVFIRKPTVKDEKDFLKNVKRSRKFLHPWIVHNIHDDLFKNFLKRLKLNNESFLICSNVDGAIIGVININEIVMGAFRSGYLGFYVFKQYAGQGYMSEGMQLVMKYAFKELKLHRLEANIQPENKSSIKLVKGCGFKMEGLSPRYLKIAGRWRDHERWAIIKEDWATKV